ncbi:Signal transduction histidine kinase, homodimeric domain [Pseudocohnilembus persalinus]|uniref:Signal transduction histidine kinase, homodimeric domain n=1 Tax=Pseudocohnilembus persalinus TaxID=266149 RepID=A0A0V0QR92_PSEPJ|nr:Signal transduction histidine kinase, homodimeric domain [Pseudocohnilembus persalinus]|eukprot:KRX04544.1 Signal transduction histidine kinase, homodimeric domain [Pseudocohnilembus persalinus]
MTFQELKNISRTLQLFKDGILIITQSESQQENDQFEFPFMNDQFKKEFEIEEDHQTVFLKHNNSFGNIFSDNDLKNDHELPSQIQQSNRQVQYQQKQETTNFPPQNSYPKHLNKDENQSQISNFQNNGNCFDKNSKINSFKNFEDKGSSKISSQIEYLLQLVVTNINKQQSRQLGINTNNNQQNYQNNQQTLYTKIKKMFAQQNNTNNNNLNSDNIQQSQFIPNTERYNLVILDDETKEKNYYEISLDKSIWKEQQSVIVVFRNVTETFRADELQRLNEQKDIIMATVSHDLKNPIAGIIGCIEQVLNQNTVSDFADKYSQNLLLNSQNNSSSNKDISKQNFEINVHNQAVLVNSIPNMGITKEIMSVLFDEFQTTDNNTNSYGVGLGLCIAQKLANCVGPQQKIQVKSSPGVGSKFSFKIYTHRKQDNELIKESYQDNENYHSQTMISPSKIQVKMPLISGPTKLIDGLSTSNSQQFYSPRNSINKQEINNQNFVPEKNNKVRVKQESKFDKLFQDDFYNQSPFLNKKTMTQQQIQSDMPLNMYKSQLEGSQQQQKQQQCQQIQKHKHGNQQMKAQNQEYDQETDNNTNYFNKSPTQNLTQSNMVLQHSNFLIKSRQLISSQAIHNINRQVSMTPAQIQNKFIQQFLQNYQKIMLVDDQIFNIKSQKIFLSRFGKFQYYECIDGEEAVQQIKDIQEKQKDNTSNFEENQIDMILLDKQMGRFKMNGLQAAEQIKALCPNILIILCTSQLEPDEKYSYIDGSIEKPISVAKFYQLIQVLLKEQECVSDVQNLSPSLKQKYW